MRTLDCLDKITTSIFNCHANDHLNPLILVTKDLKLVCITPTNIRILHDKKERPIFHTLHTPTIVSSW